MDDKKFILFCLFIGCIPFNNSFAEDSLAALMQRMKSESAARIEYQETRILELFDQPWVGSGFMYSSQPDLMIREQLQPSRLLMGVKGNEVYYLDPEKGVHHQGAMDEENPLSLNISVFKALINADEALLHRFYYVKFSTNSKRWVMNLNPKTKGNSGLNIVVSGIANQQLDTIIIKQKDGDTSEFTLKNMTTDDGIKKTIDRLYGELQGK